MFKVGDHVLISGDTRTYVVVTVNTSTVNTYDLALATDPKTVVVHGQPEGGMKIATS